MFPITYVTWYYILEVIQCIHEYHLAYLSLHYVLFFAYEEHLNEVVNCNI